LLYGILTAVFTKGSFVFGKIYMFVYYSNTKGGETTVTKKTKKRAYPIIVAVFALCVALVCLGAFLVFYNAAYDHSPEPGGYIPPSWGVGYYFFLITIGSLVFGGIVELIIDFIDRRIRIWPLFLCAALLPSICFGTYYHLFKKGNTLYFLVEDGGALNFIVDGDYNRNGYIDEYERRYSETYETSLHYEADENNENVDFIQVYVTGRGFIHRHTDLSFDEEENVITIGFEKGQVEYDKIVISVVFKRYDTRDKLLFYRVVDGERVLQNYSVFHYNKRANVTITGDMISKLIAESGTDTAELKFIFTVNEK